MLASNLNRARRRGIVLILVLAMIGLLALIGVTFATYSGQAKINTRNYMLSVLQPQADELLDFALSQLIGDTEDIRSAIRGHSMARDMFGNDAYNNGFLAFNPATGALFAIQNFLPVPGVPNLWDFQTNISIPGGADPTFYGYDFTRWILRLSYLNPPALPHPVDQTFEILIDNSTDNPNLTQLTGNGVHVFRVTPIDTTTGIFNPTAGAANGWSNWQNAALPIGWNFLTTPGNPATFILDGRWLHAFNGTGMGAKAVYGNFRHNGNLLAGNPGPAVPGSPRVAGMDEDYDACDLENWFLAMQSADGHVIIPSFHRPAIIRYDPTGAVPVNDWARHNVSGPNGTSLFADSAARILRPVAFDGHDQATFPDLIPDATTGKITYDVDNDGDGISDSVWLDLGYPARKDSRGQLYKPLFAFMVIGLNGRIPLNTAGNLAGLGQNHTTHYGNSVSEVDPTYALQNANQGPLTDIDPFNLIGIANGAGTPNAANWQVDNATVLGGTQPRPVDVRLTQLRNLLAGTRPQVNPFAPDTTGQTNGDDNLVGGSWAGGTPYFMPNGIADGADNLINANPPQVQRTAQPSPGRWGEAQSVPGVPVPIPNTAPPQYGNYVVPRYNNPVRAGYSFDMTDLLFNIANGTTLSRDAADDNYNVFDPFPINHNGEVGDVEFYDPAGGELLPIDRFRRFVTPLDIDGSGVISTFGMMFGALGPDSFGRVQYSSYFRPPGAPGTVSIFPNAANFSPLGDTSVRGQIYYPPVNPPVPPNQPPFYTAGYVPPNPSPSALPANTSFTQAYKAYLGDTTNNLLHGFESYKLPSIALAGATGPDMFTETAVGGMPVDQNFTTPVPGPPNPNPPPPTLPAAKIPGAYPTYDAALPGQIDGLNEADEMNLYTQNPLLDSPFGPSDLEWLYRQQDVDGSSLTSRMKDLAPISFTNTIDGQRRRRLFAIDSWELNNYVWANDNPGNAFPNNSSFTAVRTPNLPYDTSDASFATLSAVAGSFFGANGTELNGKNFWAPALAHRQKKINLNYPLPVSNAPDEPVRQKWIDDTYQLLKVVLPPRSVDTAEELAQLGQFVVNIIDFRDPDATITIWTNPDVSLVPGTLPNPPASLGTPPTLVLNPAAYTTPAGAIALVQYGMEYNPVALNEVLAYSYAFYNPTGTGPTQANQLFVELVSTLTQSALAALPAATPPATNPADPSILDLGGFAYTPVAGGVADPYINGTWDIMFTGDDPASRPDPFRGDLVLGGNYYAPVPLNKDAFVTPTNQGDSPPTSIPGFDVTLQPLTPAGPPPAPLPPTVPPPPTAPGSNYFYVFGSQAPVFSGGLYEYNPPTPIPMPQAPAAGSPGYPTTPVGANAAPSTYPSLVQYFNGTTPTVPSFDPLNGTAPTINWYAGILPGSTGIPGPGNPPGTPPPTGFQWKLPPLTLKGAYPGPTRYFWVCLRRPANPFAPVSAINPMVVVDSMRVPYIDGSVQPTVNGPTTGTPPPPPKVPNVTLGLTNAVNANALFSAQRLQPYRGGHAVPNPYAPPPPPPPAPPPPAQPLNDARYGYTEQIAALRPSPAGGGTVSTAQWTQGIYYVDTTQPWPKGNYYGTDVVYHTLGQPNESAEPWDYFPFHDRDFSSVAELLLVPGCPPGLFTKQFAEFAPSQYDYANIFSVQTPQANPIAYNTTPPGPVVPGPPNSPPPPPGALLTGSWPFSANNVPGIAGSPVPPIVPHAFPYLLDKFYYTGASLAAGDTFGTTVGGPAGDGWSKMLEFFEVPSMSMGAIGPVASGTNFDWARQDAKPGLLNPNLIIDEEVFFSLLGKSQGITEGLLNFIQLPALMPGNLWHNPNDQSLMPLLGNTPILQFGPPVPLVVSAIDSAGRPSYYQPISNASGLNGGSGATYSDPIRQVEFPALSSFDSRIKAAFAQFLWLRHGGSGYIFGFGSGFTGQNSAVVPYDPPNPPPAPPPGFPAYLTGIPAERPFHSLSYPDLDFTVMRPAALPPSPYTNPILNITPTPPAFYTSDPGVKNPNIFLGYSSGGVPGNTLAAGTAVVPPAIPARRLFQVPDAYAGNTATTPPIAASNASESGDPYINNVTPVPPTAPALTVPSPAPGALPPWAFPVAAPTTPISFLNGYPPAPAAPPPPPPQTSYPNLFWSVWPDNIFPPPPAGPASVYLGQEATAPAAGGPQIDNRQHPFWRTEQLQRIMNLTTVRTHQYAVWITIGFFEVKRQGDINMAFSGSPTLAYDLFGPEWGSLTGKTVRFRGFFLVNRLNLSGFNPGSPGAFRAAVTYRQRIQ
jgi:hypothetical protein